MTSTAARREPVTRDRAITAAVALADAQGLGSLSMRRLAQELGVEAMSLYHHVANKEAVLDGMVDRVFAEIELPAPGAAWKEAMRDRARSARTTLLRHPWAISLLDSRSSPGPATLRHHDAVLGCCRAAGFSPAMAAHALSLIDSYVHGFVTAEVALPFREGDDLTEVLEPMLAPYSADEHPNLLWLTTEHVLQPGYRYADEFEFGLGLVLDGLEAAARLT
jgi:AcrR family transcriptional regulator